MMKRNDISNWKRIGTEIEKQVRRIRSLCPDHRDPHRFHEEKSEIAHELSKLAKEVM